MDTEDDPLLQDAWQEEEDEEVAFSSWKRREGAVLCGKSPCRARPLRVPLPMSGFWNIVGWVFTNPYCAGSILFLGCAIPAVLAAIMFLHYPALDIDISYNAFEIRNHESSQRFDALALALKSQFGSWGRSRRDLAEFTSETLQRLIFQRLQQLHLNTTQPGVGVRGRRSAPEGSMGTPEPHGPSSLSSPSPPRPPSPPSCCRGAATPGTSPTSAWTAGRALPAAPTATRTSACTPGGASGPPRGRPNPGGRSDPSPAAGAPTAWAGARSRRCTGARTAGRGPPSAGRDPLSAGRDPTGAGSAGRASGAAPT